MAYVDDLNAMSTTLGSILESYKGEGPAPYNSLHIALATGIADGSGAEEALIAQAQETLASFKDSLEAKGIRLVSLTVPNAPKWPRQYSFPLATGYTEEPMRRNMNP